jgi:hypothetical protein
LVRKQYRVQAGFGDPALQIPVAMTVACPAVGAAAVMAGADAKLDGDGLGA